MVRCSARHFRGRMTVQSPLSGLYFSASSMITPWSSLNYPVTSVRILELRVSSKLSMFHPYFLSPIFRFDNKLKLLVWRQTTSVSSFAVLTLVAVCPPFFVFNSRNGLGRFCAGSREDRMLVFLYGRLGPYRSQVTLSLKHKPAPRLKVIWPPRVRSRIHYNRG
jgi:hypothetical protein